MKRYPARPARLPLLTALLLASTTVAAETCLTRTINRPVPFDGNGGEIIQLDDDSIWRENSYQYLNLRLYYPKAVICPFTGRMTVAGHRFEVLPVDDVLEAQ